jgi:hypothetical protein
VTTLTTGPGIAPRCSRCDRGMVVAVKGRPKAPRRFRALCVGCGRVVRLTLTVKVIARGRPAKTRP